MQKILGSALAFTIILSTFAAEEQVPPPPCRKKYQIPTTPGIEFAAPDHTPDTKALKDNKTHNEGEHRTENSGDLP